ncbi:MAG TPA: hypothetical protein VMM18_06025 [Gemmatimonadaceae bacterium]|nr:hypothetical protein [Gemmatimonadaceae bacterium]
MPVHTRIRLELTGLAQLPPDFDPDEEGFVYGKAFASCQAALTEAARRLGVLPLQRFSTNELDLYDEIEHDVMRELEDDDEANEEIENQLNQRGNWHDAEDGLHTLVTLIAHFENGVGAETELAGGWRVRDVLWDLRAFESILEAARANNRRFRIAVGG